MSDMNNPSDENSGALDDLWADALNEQKTTPTKSAADAVFQQLGGGDVSGTLQDIDLIMDIPVKLTVELGRTRMTIKELLRLTQGSVVAQAARVINTSSGIQMERLLFLVIAESVI